MTLLDCLKYLFGDREAILRIASTRGALVVGALLVLTGSLARNYDGKDLVHEWDALLHGIGVSFGNALALHSIVHFAAFARRVERPRFWRGFLSFLGLFWMTAPMAWLYAIPFEQFQSPVDAIYSNAYLLGFVSIWRVVLITRVLAVIWGAKFITILFMVLMFADAVVIVGSLTAPVPMVDFMGGLQHSPEERALASLNLTVMFWSMMTAGIWLIGGLVAICKFKGKWSGRPVTGRVAPTTWAVPVMAFAALAPALWKMQPQQQRRYRVETMLRAGDVAGGFAEMSRHARSDYPKVWDPPPRQTYFETVPDMEQVRAVLVAGGQEAWVRQVYLAKSWRIASSQSYRHSVRTPLELEEHYQRVGPPRIEEKPILKWHLLHDERLTRDERDALARILGPEETPEPAAADEDGG